MHRGPASLSISRLPLIALRTLAATKYNTHPANVSMRGTVSRPGCRNHMPPLGQANRQPGLLIWKRLHPHFDVGDLVPDTLPPALPSATMRQWRYHNLKWGASDVVEPNVECYTKRRGFPTARNQDQRTSRGFSLCLLGWSLSWSSCPAQSHAEPNLGPNFGMLLTQHMRRGRQLPTLDDSSDERVDLG